MKNFWLVLSISVFVLVSYRSENFEVLKKTLENFRSALQSLTTHHLHMTICSPTTTGQQASKPC
jgi:hypothetical protein